MVRVTGNFDDPRERKKWPPVKPPKSSAVQRAKFRNDERTATRPMRYHMVTSALGRPPTKEEKNRLRTMGYSPKIHTISVRKGKNGKNSFKIMAKKKKN